MLTVKIWDIGCGCDLEIDPDGFISVKNSGGNDVESALGGCVLHYAEGEEQELAEEILADWCKTYEGNPSTNGLVIDGSWYSITDFSTGEVLDECGEK